MKSALLFAALGIGFSLPLPAVTFVSLGSIGVFTGVGTAPNNNLVFVHNQTGATAPGDCTTATAQVCTAINILSWTADLEYTLAPGVSGPASPATVSGGVIAPNNDYLSYPLDGSLPYSILNSCCDAIVTKVVFSGTLSQSSFQVTDGTAGGALFIAQNPFTFTYIPSSAYQNGEKTWDMTDLLVPNYVGGESGGSIPEPGTMGLLLAGLGLIATARRSSG